MSHDDIKCLNGLGGGQLVLPLQHLVQQTQTHSGYILQDHFEHTLPTLVTGKSHVHLQLHTNTLFILHSF